MPRRSLFASLVVLILAPSCGSTPVAPPDNETPTDGAIGASLRTDAETGALAVDKLATRGAGTKAGILLHEYIWAIDGQSVIGVPLADNVARIRGPIGTQVTLRVGTSEAEAREVVVTRAELPPDVLECHAGDCANGTGTSTNRFGDRYEGQFQNGTYHGLGKLVEPSGRAYEGQFVNGAASGPGVFTSMTGRRVEGTFEAGYPLGVVRVTLPDGDVYEGETKNFAMHGPGKLTRPSTGDVWEGRFEFDRLIDGTWLHAPSGGDGRTCTRAVMGGVLATTGSIAYAPQDPKKRVTFEGPFGDDCVAEGEGLMTYTKKKMQGPFSKDEPQKGAKVMK